LISGNGHLYNNDYIAGGQPGAGKAMYVIYTLVLVANEISVKTAAPANEILSLTLTETPVFAETN
jgi:hypothetical protein